MLYVCVCRADISYVYDKENSETEAFRSTPLSLLSRDSEAYWWWHTAEFFVGGLVYVFLKKKKKKPVKLLYYAVGIKLQHYDLYGDVFKYFIFSNVHF